MNEVKKEYVLVKVTNDLSKLNETEVHVVDWLIDDVGDGKEVSLKEIKRYSSMSIGNAKEFVKKYDKFVGMSKTNAEKESFFESGFEFKIKGCLYALVGALIFFISTALTAVSLFAVLALLVSIILFIYILTVTKKTERGIEDYTKWNAFKKYLLL
jgi:uncharacterized membrane protein